MTNDLNPIFQAEPKFPSDETPLSLDFAQRLALTGETLSTFSVTIVDRDTLVDVTTWMLMQGSELVSDNVASFWVKDGSHNHDYHVLVSGATSLTRIINGVIILPVRERK